MNHPFTCITLVELSDKQHSSTITFLTKRHKEVQLARSWTNQSGLTQSPSSCLPWANTHSTVSVPSTRVSFSAMKYLRAWSSVGTWIEALVSQMTLFVVSASFSKQLAATGSSRQQLAATGSNWQQLAATGSSWQQLAAAGSP